MVDRLSIFALLILATTTSLAAPDSSWFCTQGTSRKRDSGYDVCGVARATTEQEARAAALAAAFKEFDGLCDRSNECKGFQTSVEPKRSECERVGDSIECRRMIEVTITEKLKVEGTASITSNAGTNEPKIYVGQKLDELLKFTGNPSQILDASKDGSGNLQILYFQNNTICINQSCSIILQHGRVQRYSDVKPGITDQLHPKRLGFWDQVSSTLGF